MVYVEIDKEKLRELVEKKWSCARMAKHFNCGAGTISRKCRLYGITLRGSRGYNGRKKNKQCKIQDFYEINGYPFIFPDRWE